MHLEIEVKFKVRNKRDIITRIEHAGFKNISTVFERNIIFDDKDENLRKNGILLRLRKTAGQSFLTVKLPVKDNIFKVRKEIEVMVDNPGNMENILNALGFRKVYIYEKRRAYYDNGWVKISLDELPFGVFIEIEGNKKDIENAARILGFNMEDAIKKDYVSLYKDYCRRNGIKFGDLTFD